MNRNIKKILMTLCGVLFLFFLAAFLLPVFFNPKYHKSGVEKYLSYIVGLPCELAGRVEFSLIPQTSISFTNLSVKNNEQFEEQEFIFIQSGQILMNPWYFFQGLAYFRRVMLAGVGVQFEENKNGVTNWSYLSGISSKFKVDLLVITDGDLHLERKPDCKTYHYSDMSLVLSDYSFDKSSGFETEGVLNDLALRLDGRITATEDDSSNQQIKIICKGDLSLRSSELVDSEKKNDSVFTGRIDGDILLPEGEMNLTLIPHAMKKRSELTEEDPVVTQLFELKGTFAEPNYYFGGQSMSHKPSMESAADSAEQDYGLRLKEFVSRLSGYQKMLKKESAKDLELQASGYADSDTLGSITIGTMTVQ